ncbi:MAG: saccharopine dehydrogenase NADP-binding domain-containing protein [Dethiobacteria bacterium]|jgi:lysine 6-dehydrogenase
MKILLLGGCAEMAAPIIPRLLAEEDVELVTLGDLNEEKARRLAESDPRLAASRVDATDSAAVAELMRQHDLSISYIGPFYRFERPMAQASIEAGRSYVSICDDYDAYLDVITLDEEAREKGVKILTGFGNSPGITQILAKKGYLSMAEPRRINVHWCAGSDEAVGPSNLAHLFHIFNGTTLQWLDGREVRVKTGRGKKVVEFPPPIGRNPVYYTGHAESVSLPRNLTGLTEVTLHGGVKPPYIVALVKLLSALRLTATHKRRASLARFFHRIADRFASAGIDKSVGRVDVYGFDEDGREQHRAYTYVGHIAEITSIPCLTAALRLGRGRWDHLPGGVYAPERIVEEPDDFLQELIDRGVEIHL